jgi:protein subunit release factor A
LTLADLKLSQEQQDKVDQITNAATDGWRAYWTKHRAELEEQRDEARDAAAAEDDKKVEEVAKRHLEVVRGWPKGDEIVKKIEALLTPEQKEQLKPIRAKVRSAVGVHQAILQGPNPPVTHGADNERCMGCHMPVYPNRAQREERARQEKAAEEMKEKKP